MRLHGTMCINSKGHLEIGGCSTVDLARKFGTPLYIMDEEHIREICRDYYNSFTRKYKNALVIYASKAFLTLAMCKIIEEEGLGLDVVSGGEIYTALKADFPMEKIYFHGNNKSIEELELALSNKIGRIVVDSFYELDLLDEIAKEKNIKQKILIRVSPGIDAHTHEYIKTGQIDSKFGFPLETGQAKEAIHKALTKKNLELVGIHCHIGSQIFELKSFEHTIDVMMNFAREIYNLYGFVIKELNLGGGFGIYYTKEDTPVSIEAYADTIMNSVAQKASELGLPKPKVIVEPGRSIVGTAGTTLYTIGAIKDIPNVRKYVSVDGGMVDNIRPALYQAKYEAMLANRALDKKEEVVSIAGKCCESGDMLIWDIELPVVKSGDLLAVSSTGAYCYSMSSNYNKIGRPAVVFVKDGQADLVVKRESYEDLLRNDIIPERLKDLKKLNKVAL